MTADLGELERLARAATPGEWRWDGDDRERGNLRAPSRDTGPIQEYVLRAEHDYHRDRDEIDALDGDAAFIAAANPAAILALISRLRGYEFALDTAQSQLVISNDRLRAAEGALRRQADNMAFVLNHAPLPEGWYDKFTRELAEDRSALPHPVREGT